ncbi:glycosyltransferase [Pelagibacterales bacterium SAG-MED49]|nr:glycosyltransferase [Pelagibacterales bacterium SAG-MED49]
MKLVLFIAPFYNRCGITDNYHNFFSACNKSEKSNNITFKVFNYFDEFNHLKKKYIIQNPLKFNFVFRFLEQKIPWLYYRIWMILVFVHLQVVLPIVINQQQKKYSEVIIVSQMSTIAVAFVSLYFSFNKNVKFYVWIAGLVYKNFLRKLIWQNILKNYKGIVIPTNDMRKNISNWTNSKRIYEIPNPLLTDEMKKLKKKNFIYKSNNIFKVVCIGRLSRQKGFDVLIKAISEISDVKLDIIGDGEEKIKLTKLKKELCADNKINFLGWKHKPWKSLKNYDLFVMPSRWEGPGHTVIEALCQNIPVIVSDCKYGPKETIKNGKYGIYFKKDDVAGLRRKIIKVKNNYHIYKKKSLEGGSFIRNYYSTEKIIEKYIKMFLKNN